MHRLFPIGLAVFVLCSSLVFGVSAVPVQADETEQLQSLLKRLNLKRLQATHLENRLKEEKNSETQSALAKQLADLYVNRLLEIQETDAASFASMVDRVNRLLLNYPETDSKSVRVLLLQAEYLQSEKSLNKWLEDRREAGIVRSAAADFERLAKKFNDYRRSLAVDINALNEKLGDRLPGREQNRIEEQMNQLTRVQARSTYFGGWANYYCGIAQRDLARGKTFFERGEEQFAEMLGIDLTSKFEEELDPSWLGLQSRLMAQSLVGMGLCEAAMGNVARHTLIFKILQDSSVNFSVAQKIPTWELQGYLNVDKFSEANLLAKKILSKDSEVAETERAVACVTLVRTGFSAADSDIKEPSKIAIAKQLGQIGLEELVRLRRFTFIDKLVEKYNFDTSGSSFYLQWLTGYRLYMAAEKSKQKSDFSKASTLLEQAIGMPAASSDLKSLAICRTQLAWCKFRLEDFEQAGKLFSLAIPTLKKTDRDMSVRAAWMKYESYQKLSKKKTGGEATKFQNLAKQSLEEVIKDYPGTDSAKNAEYQLTRLKRSSKSTAQTIADLRKINSSNPNYKSALYEICLLQQQIWWAARNDKSKFATETGTLYAACEKYVSVIGSAKPDRKIRVLMIAADAAIRQQPSDLGRAKDFLGRADLIASSVDASKLIEYHYQHFQVAQKSGNRSGAISHAKWLMEKGNGSPYQKSAIITLARDADKQVADADATEKNLKIREAIEIYAEMVSLFGDSEEVLAKSKNSRVAVSKLASYYMQLGENSKAADFLSRLTAAVPKDRNILLRYSKSSFNAGQFAESLPSWRRLLKASKEGTNEWYEAKFHVISCLQKTDPSSAMPVYDQFRKLHPNPPAEWKTKFASFEKLLKK